MPRERDEIRHARGFNWGPESACGASGPLADHNSKATCFDCLLIHSNDAAFKSRVEALTRTHGPPPANGPRIYLDVKAMWDGLVAHHRANSAGAS